MAEPLEVTPAIAEARAAWRYRGAARPEFAEPTGPGEESVWDFPRPPRLEPVAAELAVFAGAAEVARTRRGSRVLETAGAPTYYFPPEDVDESLLEPVAGQSVCEWKGVAASFRVAGVEPGAWCYPVTFPEFTAIRGWYAFYPVRLTCLVSDQAATPQPGGYYGGWVLPNLRGPIKGGPGSGHW